MGSRRRSPGDHTARGRRSSERSWGRTLPSPVASPAAARRARATLSMARSELARSVAEGALLCLVQMMGVSLKRCSGECIISALIVPATGPAILSAARTTVLVLLSSAYAVWLVLWSVAWAAASELLGFAWAAGPARMSAARATVIASVFVLLCSVRVTRAALRSAA